MLDDRKSAILQALVEEHIRTGEPVSSRAIQEASGLAVSTATIRNELVDLEQAGFVTQPHTSAGRVPSDLTYRYYVDHLSPVQIGSRTRSRISEFFTSMHRELTRLLQETSDLLADITHYPAVVVGPGLVSDTIHGVHLVRLGPDTVMVVLVSDSGRVGKEIARLPRAASRDEIDTAEHLLEEAFCGRSIGDAVASLERIGRQPERVLDVVRAAATVARRSETATRDVYLGGTSMLAALWVDLEKVHRVLEFLDRETTIRKLLEDDMAGTAVRIGSELPVAGDLDLAVVSRSYQAGDGKGRVGVLGPKRMDYKRTIRVVEEVSEGLGDRLRPDAGE